MVFSCGLLSKRITIVLCTKQCRCHWTRHWPRVFAKHNSRRTGIRNCSLRIWIWNPGEILTFRRSFVAYPARQARSIFGRHLGNIWITFSYGQRKPASLSCGLAGTSFAYVSPRVPPHMDCEVCAGADRNSDFTRFWIGCHQACRAEAYEFHNRAFPATASRSSSKVQPRGYTDARTQVVGELSLEIEAATQHQRRTFSTVQLAQPMHAAHRPQVSARVRQCKSWSPSPNHQWLHRQVLPTCHI